jgi:hypothetical protein
LLRVLSIPNGRHLPGEDYRNTPEDHGDDGRAGRGRARGDQAAGRSGGCDGVDRRVRFDSATERTWLRPRLLAWPARSRRRLAVNTSPPATEMWGCGGGNLGRFTDATEATALFNEAACRIGTTAATTTTPLEDGTADGTGWNALVRGTNTAGKPSTVVKRLLPPHRKVDAGGRPSAVPHAHEGGRHDDPRGRPAGHATACVRRP